MVNIGNGTGRATGAAPWRQHWSVLIPTVATNLAIVFVALIAALYAAWTWPATLILAVLCLIPSLVVYARWQRHRLFITATDIIIESSLLTTQSVSFPIRDIDMLEARKPLFGKVFNYGDITIFSGPNTQAFKKLHPFDSFMAAYHARRELQVPWLTPAGRPLSLPADGRLLGPPQEEPQRQRGPVIEGRYRRLDIDLPAANDTPDRRK